MLGQLRISISAPCNERRRPTARSNVARRVVSFMDGPVARRAASPVAGNKDGKHGTSGQPAVFGLDQARSDGGVLGQPRVSIPASCSERRRLRACGLHCGVLVLSWMTYMANYRRVWCPGGTYFFTHTLARRRNLVGVGRSRPFARSGWKSGVFVQPGDLRPRSTRSDGGVLGEPRVFIPASRSERRRPTAWVTLRVGWFRLWVARVTLLAGGRVARVTFCVGRSRPLQG